MAFNAANMLYPTPNLQHMFTRHKADWGYAGQNWNNATRAAFTTTVNNFITNNATVHDGTYHGEDAWLVVEQAAPHKCAIVHRPSYDIWSGWNLSDAQFQHANNPPYSLGGGALLAFGNLLEDILAVRDHSTLDELAQKFLDTYKAAGKQRHDEASEKALIDLFAVLDNYAPPEVAKQLSGSNKVPSLDKVKQSAQATLAILEKHSE